MNNVLRKGELVFDFLESLILYSLDAASRSVRRTIAVFIALPIVICAVIYWLCGAIVFDDGSPLPKGINGLFYSLYYSIATFTGIEPANLAPRCTGLWLTALEAVLACILIAVAIGYIVNRLSSR
jgi:L-asparagine transporter-like permease